MPFVVVPSLWTGLPEHATMELWNSQWHLVAGPHVAFLCQFLQKRIENRKFTKMQWTILHSSTKAALIFRSNIVWRCKSNRFYSQQEWQFVDMRSWLCPGFSLWRAIQFSKRWAQQVGWPVEWQKYKHGNVLTYFIMSISFVCLLRACQTLLMSGGNCWPLP